MLVPRMEDIALVYMRVPSEGSILGWQNPLVYFTQGYYDDIPMNFRGMLLSVEVELSTTRDLLYILVSYWGMFILK